ncbi:MULTISPECIES: pentapeptide repeat-containing protein [unclassified Saccharothrix]|uniref:pentapeptide repeat-containing protein n=1 Tax=unclassified Saccharothrix TaxID=2593673 RepID=UPI00307E194B
MAESSGTRDPWQPPRWPASAEAVEAFREWLADPSQPLYALELDLRGADLSGGPFVESWFSRANMADTVLRGIELWAAHCEGTRFIRADLTEADLVRALVPGASFVRAKLVAANLTKADARDARFTEADLSGANLTDATFIRADFSRANLSGAVVESTSFQDAVLVDATVVGMRGTVHGPAEVVPGLKLVGAELEQWFGARGAAVSVLRTQSV